MRISDWSSDVCSSDLQFAGTDVLSMSGQVRVAVLDQATGTVVEVEDVTLNGITTVADLVAQMNTQLDNATASLDSNGHLVITADAAGNGIAINEMDSAVDRKSTRLNSSH